MTKKRPDRETEAAIVRAAENLQAALDELERITSRSAKVELTSRNEMVRASELLQRAAESHREFLTNLGALTQAVGELRDRQNASAERLSQHAERLDVRRLEYEALEQRFGGLGESARAIGVLLKENEDPELDPAVRHANLVAVREKLAAAVEDAKTLYTDAKGAEFAELEKQAHAIKQQLQSLLNKLVEVDTPLN